MTDLRAAYEELAHPCTHEQLADHHREAKRRAEPTGEFDPEPSIGPIAMLATAVPACTTLSVAIHVIHMLPTTEDRRLAGQLVDNAETSAALALDRCHQALELDGRAHDYGADEWLPAVHDIAATLLLAARMDREPPSLVEQAQEAVAWLSRAIIDLDQDNYDATAAIADGLGHTLALYVFANVARHATADAD